MRNAIWATRFQFLAIGLFSGAWGVHIPSVKARYALSEASLALVLMSAAVGAVLSLLIAGRVIARLGPRRTAALTALTIGSLMALVLHWPSVPVLLAAMLLFGACSSLYDVSINTEGSALEAMAERAIMGNLHGMFSLGGMLGAAITGAMLRAQWIPTWQLAGVGLFIAVWVALTSRGMLRAHPVARDEPEGAHFAWPRGTLLVIGLLIFSGMCAEGVMYDWSVLYLKQELHLPQSQAAWGYAAFSAAMAITRFSGDWLRMHVRERLLLQIGGGTGAIAMAVLLLVQDPWLSLLGYALVGAGVAQVVPILFNAATRVPGTTRAAAIAAVSSIGYGGFMVGPPLIGSIAHHSSLTLAMSVVVVMCAALGLWAHRVPEKN
jgi:predicted MFS family arabinose efflux permease